ncbi:MAG: hypothetical protein QNJ60_20420 [Xenococcaceae cyanobacterium MO_188.B19]|nr:hypothetical protein [Xenococcaceae cyanobacterium MO_188.B19]
MKFRFSSLAYLENFSSSLLQNENCWTNPKSFDGLPLSNSHELKSLYQTYFDGFYGLLKWKSPLTAYGRGLKAREKLLSFMRAVI